MIQHVTELSLTIRLNPATHYSQSLSDLTKAIRTSLLFFQHTKQVFKNVHPAVVTFFSATFEILHSCTYILQYHFVHLYQQLLTSIWGAVISDFSLVIAFFQGSNIYHPLLEKSTFIPFKLH